MDIWRDIVLILAVLCVFAFGFYLMTKLDTFLSENRKSIEKESDSCEPSCVMLTTTLTDEEIIEEIHRFRSGYKEIYILLYDSSHVELTEAIGGKIQKKQ